MTQSENRNFAAQNARISALRELVRRAFPAETYTGKITSCDDRLENPDLDDEGWLYEALKGRTWADVPQQLLDAQPDGYVLLTDEAFKAFVAAWLIRSLDNIEGKNEVRDFVVYAFSPKRDMVPDTTDFTLRRLRILSTEQREALRSLLLEFARSEPSVFQRNLASDAVTLIDTLGR